MMHIEKEIIIAELSEFGYDVNEKSETELIQMFNEHCEKNSEIVEIKELIDNIGDNMICVSSPDGYQKINDFYVKTKRNCFEVKTQDHSIKCSEDHLIETMRGWVYTKELKTDDIIHTKNGYQKVKSIESIESSDVYDFEVAHSNHRYWGGTGISSHNTGKTFLALNVVREAQKMGYSVIYIDTETAVDKELFQKFDIDTKKVRIERIAIVEELKVWFAKFLDKMKSIKKEGGEIPKMMIVLDSLGQLGSRKEVNDAIEGKETADMSRSKGMKSMFRVINNDLGYLGIPLLMTNHTYMTQGMFPQEVFSGGTGGIYTASTILMLSKSKVRTGEEGEMDMSSGIKVTCKAMKNRMAKPKKVFFEILFDGGANPYKGLEYYCQPEFFETVGIAKGKMENGVFKPGGNKYYVRHLDKSFFEKQIHSGIIFNKDVLDAIDRLVQLEFKYSDLSEITQYEDEANNQLNKMAQTAIAEGVIEDSDEFELDDILA